MSMVDGPLELNALYSSLDTFLKAIHDYTSKYEIVLHRTDSHRANYRKIQPSIAEEVIKKFTYSYMAYTCQFNRKKSKSKKSTTVYNPKDYCKFVIRISLSSDFKYLKVNKMGSLTDHNHPVKLTDKSICTPKNDVLPIGQTMHMQRIMLQLSDLRKHGHFCDTVLQARDGILFAHACVLAIACPRLGTYLNRHPISNKLHNSIYLSKYTVDIVGALLDFLYEGRLNMEHFSGVQLLSAELGLSFNIRSKMNAQSTIVPDSNLHDLPGANLKKKKVLNSGKTKKINTKGGSLQALKEEKVKKSTVKPTIPNILAKVYRCSDCGKRNQTSRDMLLHRLIYCSLAIARSKEHICKVCDAACNNISALHSHMNLSHGIKKAKFKCPTCSFAFFSKRNMLIHFGKAKCKGSVGSKEKQDPALKMETPLVSLSEEKEEQKGLHAVEKDEIVEGENLGGNIKNKNLKCDVADILKDVVDVNDAADNDVEKYKDIDDSEKKKDSEDMDESRNFEDSNRIDKSQESFDYTQEIENTGDLGNQTQFLSESEMLQCSDKIDLNTDNSNMNETKIDSHVEAKKSNSPFVENSFEEISDSESCERQVISISKDSLIKSSMDLMKTSGSPLGENSFGNVSNIKTCARLDSLMMESAMEVWEEEFVEASSSNQECAEDLAAIDEFSDDILESSFNSSQVTIGATKAASNTRGLLTNIEDKKKFLGEKLETFKSLDHSIKNKDNNNC